jgi:hypothetical protein
VPLPRRPTTVLLLGVLALVLAVAGCGGSSKKSSAGKPAAAAVALPPAQGRTLQQLLASVPGGQSQPILAPSVGVLNVGTDRFGFAIFDVTRKLLYPPQVALYTAAPDGRNLKGPFRAVAESLAVQKTFQSKTVAQDPAAARAVWVAHLPLPRRGKVVIAGVVQLGGRLLSTTATEQVVGQKGPHPPNVGEKAIRVHTPTVASVHGDMSKIDTRIPPAPSLHQVDLATVLGKKPVVLVFATPEFCQSRVCGPVVDIERQVQAATGSKVAFVHMEVYRDNDPSKGYRPQFTAWRLPSEPWTFVIDRSGRVAARFEGALSAAELQRAVARVA